MPKLTTITIDAKTARLLKKLVADIDKAPSGPVRRMGGGWTTTRGVAKRMLLSEGGANGRLSRAGLQVREPRGDYKVTSAALGLGLGRQGSAGPEWHLERVVEYMAARPYHK